MAIKKFQIKNGFSVIELLIVIAISVIAMTSLLDLISFSFQINSLAKNTTQARDIIQEAMESARNIRDGTVWNTDGLGTFSTSTDYHPEKSGSPSKWTLTAGSQTIGIFTRKIVFDDVRRDVSNNIVASGGTVDLNTKKVTVTVNWVEGVKNRQEKIITYLTNWK